MDAPALEAIDVSKRYRRRGPWALEGLSFAIAPGTMMALVGPNGAGKTTLIRSFIGFERPTVGVLRVCGRDVRSDRRGVIDTVGYVSQSSALYRGLTVGAHLDLAQTLRGSFDTRLASARLARFHIGLERKVSELSGGQRAQVMLSLALGTRAPVLLLDEPLASLDPLARHDFLSTLVEDVRERGATVLMSSHIVSDIESACDSIIVLADGALVLHDTTAHAVSFHRIRPGPGRAGSGVVATFARPGGELVTLERSTDRTLRTATLEELVMGYLATGRREPEPPR